MRPEDRFGFPLPVWSGYMLALAVGLASLLLLFKANYWPGWVGGAVGLLAALIGCLTWRKALRPLDGPTTLLGLGYDFWLGFGLVVSGTADSLETRLNIGPLRLVDIILPSVFALCFCGFLLHTFLLRLRSTSSTP